MPKERKDDDERRDVSELAKAFRGLGIYLATPAWPSAEAASEARLPRAILNGSVVSMVISAANSEQAEKAWALAAAFIRLGIEDHRSAGPPGSVIVGGPEEQVMIYLHYARLTPELLAARIAQSTIGIGPVMQPLVETAVPAIEELAAKALAILTEKYKGKGAILSRFSTVPPPTDKGMGMGMGGGRRE